MKNSYKILAIALFVILVGWGCNNGAGQKITQQKIQDLKKKNSSVTLQAGPFAGVKFNFYDLARGESVSNFDLGDGDVLIATSEKDAVVSASSTNKVAQAIAIQKPLEQILSGLTDSEGSITYTHTFNGKVIDEVRCAHPTNSSSLCKRYLAIDPNRSVIISHFKPLTLADFEKAPAPFELFDFEIQAVKPASGDWYLYENSELPFTFYYQNLYPNPMLGAAGIFLKTTGSNKLFKESFSEYSVDVPFPNSTSTKNPAVHIKAIQGDAQKFITEQLAAMNVVSSTQEIVGGVSVTSFCYKLEKEKMCEYYFLRPGQDTVRIVDGSNQQLYKTLRFKHYYPYEPFQILEEHWQGSGL